MTYNETLIRKAASLARRAGFWVIISDSHTTGSSYLYVGRPSKEGGLTTLAKLRVSDHRRPGYFRGGWIGGGLSFDLRPRSRRYDRERVDNFIKKVVVIENAKETKR